MVKHTRAVESAKEGCSNESRLIAAALARMDDGTFGLCVACRRPIERARIDAMPLVELCAGCACAPDHPRGMAA
jgi:DnaK suppressor protein